MDMLMTDYAHTLPPHGCDCHVHVFGPYDRYPLAADRSYTPGIASVGELTSMLSRLGLTRVVIVQASPQGTDNACLIDALERINAQGAMQARGVAVIDDHISDAQLQAMHQAGVRGVRVNLESAGQHNPEVARQLMQQAARRVVPLGWHVQTYTSLAVIASLADTLAALPVPVVIDHFGRATASQGVMQSGFEQLQGLVASGQAWIKLSAAQRISDRPDCEDVQSIARALVDANPKRMVWGSDWPHPGAWPGRPRSPDTVEPFHPVNDHRALQRLSEWLSAAEWVAMLQDNPATLYDF
ncbi:MAG: amidohydrolase family protein [Hylemonella sp.]